LEAEGGGGMNKYDCPRCDGIGRIEIDSPEGDYRTACTACGSTGKRMVTVPLEEYETLKSEIDRLQAERDAAIEDMALISGQANSALKCNCCKYNPNDMGCELDGSQFDDDGECHFQWRGLGDTNDVQMPKM